jgi:hypothetical protein
MLKLRARFEGRCPRHPRYRPQHGAAAIRAGCEMCGRLYGVWRAWLSLEAAIHDFEDWAEKAEAAQARRSHIMRIPLEIEAPRCAD